MCSRIGQTSLTFPLHKLTSNLICSLLLPELLYRMGLLTAVQVSQGCSFWRLFLCSVLTPHSRPPPPSAWSLTAQCNHYSYTLAALPYNQEWGQSRDPALQCDSTFKQAEFQVDNCMWLANDVINVQMAFGRTKLPHPSLGP